MPSQKPDLPPLKTPKSFSFPSEIQDDPKVLSVVDVEIKREDGSDSATSSIPTPSAYTDFLNALTPVYNSPTSAGGSFPKFKFETCGPSPTSQPSSAISPAFSSAPSLKSPAISLPPQSPCSVKSSKPTPALRRLRIPQSIKTFGISSPRAATPLTTTPLSATPRSAATLYSPFSPSDWKIRYFETPRSATTAKSVSVRQVVTRTITYKRTPLDPPPKGKRRKTQDCKDHCKELCKEPYKETLQPICKEA
ncbi:hypothetical protein N7478_003536 [Penicillium angulare]|uniref:uncharacterized protein n=1 Tax=Penicillium angulare TaxID=116970 RepID=UPI002541230C|nr:uncharacterized protein N7478_003536 [Penicillium angulare]KAJ5287850.1 hypothetical protein N7478_003536 [Penicillium angulare]